MNSLEMDTTSAGPGSGPAWLSGERLVWLAIAGLLAALLVVRSSVVPERALLFANPLALALFVAVYRLIRIREGNGRP